MVLVLVRRFGYARLDEIEDALHQAAVKALAVWPEAGVPPNPVAWLITVARNLVFDAGRRKETADRKSADVVQLLYAGETDPGVWAGPLEDDVLKMMIVCTDPALGQRDSATIILRLICNLTVGEIARGLLTSVPAVRKQLTRAKARIREARISFELPDAELSEDRIDRVLLSIYMLYNEGYLALQGSNLVRREFCAEAERLVALLLQSSVPNKGKIHALSSLLSFQSSRMAARVNAEGRALSLAEQDRSLWDQERIRDGLIALGRSMSGRVRSRYHLEAAIAACHATARTYQDTDWQHIRSYYDDLAVLFPSPVVDLNRAVAIRMTDGPAVAITVLEALERDGQLTGNYLLPALMGDFHRALGQNDKARVCYETALEQSLAEPVGMFLMGQIELCNAAAASAEGNSG